jgi:hypothetical protein
MMRRLDNRGVAAWEFCLVFFLLLVVLVTIFDVGRYMITMQSLRALASAGARATMIDCYTPNVTDEASAGTTPATCTDIATYLPDAERQAVAPFLYFNGGAPTMSTVAEEDALSITASMAFDPIMPVFWGNLMPSPTANMKIPF